MTQKSKAHLLKPAGGSKTAIAMRHCDVLLLLLFIRLFYIRFIFMQIKWNSDQFGWVYADARREIEGITIVANRGSLIAQPLIFGARESYACDSLP